MKNTKLQLMVHGSDISKSEIEINYTGIQLVGVDRVENTNYIFINLNIDPKTKPGSFEIVFNFPKKKIIKYIYHLQERNPESPNLKGFDASDVIYLLYPDRFANGDPLNNEYNELYDKYNRNDIHGRHGGDLQGIINHLDYFNELGVTTLWLNPVLENNQLSWSYHGYAITDFYKVDPRFGDNDLYKEFVALAHSKGMKVVKDLVFNHCGDMHWWMNDLPMPDWLNQWPDFTQSNYRQLTAFDPHASQLDGKLMTNGWFARQMPDLNQQNPYLAKYLIQNSIWWIEYANLNGFRMDTHTYCDKHFMSRWCEAVMAEFPNFSIVGETWYNHPLWVAYWQKDARNPDGYNSNLEYVMDFPMMLALQKAFDEPDGWETGMARIYELLAHDCVYADYNNLLVFLDNHDKGRFHRDSTLELSRLKLGLAYILTTRGVPQIYYGTEIILPGDDALGHGDIRRDFPGGWTSDSRSAFNASGRTKKENEIWNYAAKILHWRKGATAIHNGRLIHFSPDNGIYVYFRQNHKQCAMVIINNSHENREVITERFGEILSAYASGFEVITETEISNLKSIGILPRTAMIIELKNK